MLPSKIIRSVIAQAVHKTRGIIPPHPELDCAAGVLDKNMLVPSGLPFFQTRALGAVHIVLRHGRSRISGYLRSAAHSVTIPQASVPPDR